MQWLGGLLPWLLVRKPGEHVNVEVDRACGICVESLICV